MDNPLEDSGYLPWPEAGDWQDLSVYRREGVALLVLDRLKADRRAARQAANNLDDRLMGELQGALACVDRADGISGILLASGHRLAFSVGAKIDVVLGATFEQALSIVQRAQQLILRLHRTRKPVVAALNGLTFGGGLEIAMACDYRVAGDRGNVLFGLPETSLGILPGMGGTQNLPRLVGQERAREFILDARADLAPTAALALGLVDAVVPYDTLLETAWTWARGNAPRGNAPRGASPRGPLSKTFRPPDGEPTGDRERIRRELRDWMAGWTPDRERPGRGSPLGQAAAQFVLERTSPERWLEGLAYEQEAFAFLVATEDAQEGVRALREERPPVFRRR